MVQAIKDYIIHTDDAKLCFFYPSNVY
jgi:hypothetical protein